jgi:hypothetical protein
MILYGVRIGRRGAQASSRVPITLFSVMFESLQHVITTNEEANKPPTGFVETPEISGVRSVIHAVLFLMFFYLGFIQKWKSRDRNA